MNERSAVRLFTLRVLVVSLLFALFGRLWYIQVLAGDQYAREATTTTEHDIFTTATRGEIIDDWGRPYAENTTALVVSVDWNQLQEQADDGYLVETRLAAVLHEDVRALIDSITPCTYSKSAAHLAIPVGCYNGPPLQPIPVSDTADTTQALQILERQDDFPGVTAKIESIRHYLPQDNSLAANLIGYLGVVDAAQEKTGGYTAGSLVGASGIEKEYEADLRGTDGKQVVSLDHQGNVAAQISNTPETPGDNVVLSIDAGVQGLLENVLKQAVTVIAPDQPTVAGNEAAVPHFPTQAAGIVLNAQNGQIVASASYPSYNPKLFEFPRSNADTAAILALNKESDHPLLNQVIQGQYAPGSTFKLITTSAELNSGEANWTSKYECGSFLLVGGKPKNNSEGEALGKIDLKTTIAQSCDTVYYQFALDDYYPDYNRVVKQHAAPLENVTKMAKLYGLNAPTGVDLPYESTGQIQSWSEKAKLASFYYQQECIGAHGGVGTDGKRLPPNKDKTKRAKDAVLCKAGIAGTTILEPGDYADEYIGQGTVLATPLQMAVAYAALVNGGKVYSPKVAKAIVTPDGKLVKAITPQVLRTLDVKQSDLDLIKQAMYEVNTDGTAAAAFKNFPMQQVAVGGKTGTAQVQVADAPAGHFTDTSVFASFAGKPGQPPQYVSIIIVPDAGYGASVAAPATRLLWDGMYGLEGQPNVLPLGLRTKLPTFSLDGNLVTKGPKTLPGTSPTPPVASITPDSNTPVSPPADSPATTPSTTITTKTAPTTTPAVHTSVTKAPASPKLTPTAGGGSPIHGAAFITGGRSPPPLADAVDRDYRRTR